MRSRLAAAVLIPVGLFAQAIPLVNMVAPPPPDPLEPITGEVTLANTAEQRATLVSLASRAVDQYQMHAKGTPAHVLQIAFTATDSTLFSGGSGQLRETWISGQNWRWDATLGNYSLLRISSNGVAYDQQAPRAIPLRLKMVASAVFAPLQPRAPILRAANVTWKGTAVTCILRSFGQRPAASNPAGRQWDETEYCIDPATGLLMMVSEIPGIYVSYDYSNALRFHDRVLPGAVTITENGAAVVQAQLTSVTDTSPTDLTPFTPTAQMKSQGPAVMLGMPFVTARPVFSTDVAAGSPTQTAVIHATFDEQGNVQEYEPLQNSGLTAQAIEAVKKSPAFSPQRVPGAPPVQREEYVRVQFLPAQNQAPGWNFRHQPDN